MYVLELIPWDWTTTIAFHLSRGRLFTAESTWPSGDAHSMNSHKVEREMKGERGSDMDGQAHPSNLLLAALFSPVKLHFLKIP